MKKFFTVPDIPITVREKNRILFPPSLASPEQVPPFSHVTQQFSHLQI
jgi:hypothetical protein